MSPLSAYHSLLLSNLSTVQTIESALSNVTWLLPGRFEDAEVASEGLYALLSLVSSYHDTILSHHLSPSLSLPPHPFTPRLSSPSSSSESSPSNFPPLAATQPTLNRTQPLLPPPSDHARYTRYWTAKSALYRRASRALTTLSYVELLVEMVLRRKAGERARWRVVLGIEGLKTFLRLIILRITSRPVLSPPTPQREVDLSTLPTEILDPPNLNPIPSQIGSEVTPTKPLTPSLAAYAPLRSHLFPMAGNLPESHLQHPLDLVPRLKGSAYLAEALSSSVGLVSVLLLIRASRQPSSTRYRPTSLPTLSRSLPPYLIPLLLSLLARHFRSRNIKTTPLLLSHYATQDRRLAMRTFLTGPMWIGWTRPKVMSVVNDLERIPLLGLVGELMEGYLPLVDDYFFYTSS
ncbi:hypothetical protein CI109_103433 [Kwoniella shandongensis]|uniref:Peroxisomal membrane protein PEX16 n=1 Tax=Kwoniella shandongensis TaxID=1734106 RepID=A0A5M6BYD5_9TREE|nr:uncharacterized protein CI109_004513 [Kwoniella shandongensis]KAA5527220.1 hypothetical protein CI109_004513 [Kwoniella shandongensis]